MAQFAVHLHYTPAEFYALTWPEYVAINRALYEMHSR